MILFRPKLKNRNDLAGRRFKNFSFPQYDIISILSETAANMFYIKDIRNQFLLQKSINTIWILITLLLKRYFSTIEQKLSIQHHCSHTHGFQMDTN